MDDDDNIFDATTPIFICMSLVASAQRVIIIKNNNNILLRYRIFAHI